MPSMYEEHKVNTFLECRRPLLFILRSSRRIAIKFGVRESH
jgi:hypothetical protein